MIRKILVGIVALVIMSTQQILGQDSVKVAKEEEQTTKLSFWDRWSVGRGTYSSLMEYTKTNLFGIRQTLSDTIPKPHKTKANVEAIVLEWTVGTAISASTWYLLLQSAGESEFGEKQAIHFFIGLIAAVPLSTSLAVKITGEHLGRKGNFWKSLLGAYLGTWLPTFCFLTMSELEIPLWVIWTTWTVGPSVGAVIGYNK